MPPNYLKLFGIPELRAGSRTFAFRTRKQLALLVYLVLEGTERGVSRDLLTDLLWPDLSRGRARHSLSQALSVIRRALGPEACTRAREEVQLTCQITSQLDQLEADGLAELDRPLKGLDMCAGTAFAHWVDAARQRCLITARARLRDGLRAARLAGNVCQVHERATMLYRVDPLCDDAVLALAERALLSGDRTGAIRLLRRHIVRTKQQLGCEAGPEIIRRLRRIEAGRDVHRPEVVQPSLPSSSERQALVGRSDEVASLEATWSETTNRRLVTCLVTGPAGIGKSTLVRRFAASVESRGWPVFSVACQEIGRSIPFATVSDLIYAICRDSGVGGSDPVWLSEVSRVTPGIKSAYPGIPDPPSVPAESVRVRVAESITRVLEGLADGSPMLLLFDDVQHMDPASRDVLHVLIRRLRSSPMLLLGALRTNESRRFDFAIEPGPADFSWNTTIHLHPLDEVDAEALIAARAKDPTSLDLPVRSKLVELAEGNPYLIEMLLSDWQHDPSYSLVAAEVTGDATCARWHPPDTMRRAFARQYEGLSPVAQRMLAVLAVAGKKMTAGEIAELAALDPTRTADAAFELADRGIVRPEGRGLAFKNEMHRAFVYFACLSTESRKYHHACLAKNVKREAIGSDFQRAFEVSHHFLRANLIQQAASTTAQATDLAIAMGAPQEAERALREVLGEVEETEQSRLRLLLAKSLNAQGQYHRALHVLATVNLGDLEGGERASAQITRADALYRSRLADDNSIFGAAKTAVSEASKFGSELQLLEALQLAAEVAADKMDNQTIEKTALHAQRMVVRSKDELTRGYALITHAFCRMVSGDYINALDTFEQAATIFKEKSRDLELRRISNGQGICFTNVGRFNAAINSFKRSAELAANAGNSAAQCVIWGNLATLYEDLGWFTAAAHAYGAALDAHELAPTARLSTLLFTNAAGLAISLGNLIEAAQLLDRAEDSLKRHKSESLLLSVLMGRADLCIAAEEYEQAWKNVERMLSVAKGRTPLNGTIGQFARLHRQYVWATEGYSAMRALPISKRAVGLGNTLARKLETEAFDEWATLQEVPSQLEPSSVTHIIRYGLFGVLTRLVALHICPTTAKRDMLPSRKKSPAEFVAHTFDDFQSGRIPHSVFGAKAS